MINIFYSFAREDISLGNDVVIPTIDFTRLLLNGYYYCFYNYFTYLLLLRAKTNVKILRDKYIIYNTPKIFSRDFSRRLARGGARFLSARPRDWNEFVKTGLLLVWCIYYIYI